MRWVDHRKSFWMMSLIGLALGAMLGTSLVADMFASPPAPRPNWLQVITIYAFAGALLGGVVQFGLRAWTRYRRREVDGSLVRPLVLAALSAMICTSGFAAVLFGWNQLSDLESWNPFAMRPEALAFGANSIVIGICILIVGVIPLARLDAPSRFTKRWSMTMNYLTLVLIPIWAALCYQPLRAEASRSHSAGAGIGVFTIVVLIPAIIWLLICVQTGFLLLQGHTARVFEPNSNQLRS